MSEELFPGLTAMMQAADERVEPWQTAAKPGDCFVKVFGDLVIYGEVLEYPGEDWYDVDGSREVQGCDSDTPQGFYATPEGQHYRLTRCFSVACEDGEMGDTHVSEIGAIIDRPFFEYAKYHLWPSEMDLWFIGILPHKDRSLNALYLIVMDNERTEMRLLGRLPTLKMFINKATPLQLFTFRPCNL